jgi:hypothetical protein
MNDIASNRIAHLQSLRKAKIEWRRHYDGDPPDVGAAILRAGIAYRIRERKSGGLSRSLQSKLRLIAQGEAIGDKPIGRLKPGTKLVRRWKGRTIIVLATENGFLFEDKSYGSLSEIARKVTGARWSGPRFFALARAGKVAAHASGG